MLSHPTVRYPVQLRKGFLDTATLVRLTTTAPFGAAILHGVSARGSFLLRCLHFAEIFHHWDGQNRPGNPGNNENIEHDQHNIDPLKAQVTLQIL